MVEALPFGVAEVGEFEGELEVLLEHEDVVGLNVVVYYVFFVVQVVQCRGNLLRSPACHPLVSKASTFARKPPAFSLLVGTTRPSR